MSLKIVLAIPKLESGGPDRVFYELALGFHRMGLKPVLVVHHAGGKFWDKLPLSVERKVLLNDHVKSRYPFKQFSVVMKDVQPDVIIATLGSIITASFAKWLKRCNYPLVLRPANHLTRNAKELLKKSPVKHLFSWVINILSLHNGNHIVCQSEDLYSDFRRYGLSEKRLSIIGNPIDPPLDERIRSLVSVREQGFYHLVAIGRLTHQKGFDLLINAISTLKEKFPTVRLTILGEGPDKHFLQDQVIRLGLEQKVEFAGYSSEVEKYIVNADFLVSSSRYEGFPNAVLEALSYGTPVIATDCPGGTRTMVKDGITGWLCKTESSDSLARVIEKALYAPKLSVNEIREFVDKNFATGKIVSAYVTVLNSVIRK